MTTTHKLAFTVDEAATATGFSKATIDRAIKSGALRCKWSTTNEDGDPVGRRTILAAELQAYLESLPDG